MENVILEITISTNKEDINVLVENLLSNISVDSIIYTIIWQNEEKQNYKEVWINNNIRIITFNEKGLSRSRNRALELAIGDILLFSDDDIIFENNIYEKIIKAYKELPDADIITFKMLTKSGKPFKRYPKFIKKHNYYSIMRVSSCEISCKVKNIRSKHLKFNELFGLGSTYPSGEENLFLWNALKKGLKVYFYPEFIVTHPTPETSSHSFSPEILKSKGAFFYEVFQNWAYIIIPLFAFKKIYLEPNILKSMFYMFKGLTEYKELIKKNEKNNEFNLSYYRRE